MDVHLECVAIALIQGGFRVHIELKRGLQEKYSRTCQPPDLRARMMDVLCGWGAAGASYRRVSSRFYLLELFMSLSPPKDSKFWLVLHKLGDLQELLVVRQISKLIPLWCVNVLLTLVGVSKDWHCLVGCWKDPENKEKKIRTEEGMNECRWVSARKFHTQKKQRSSCLLD